MAEEVQSAQAKKTRMKVRRSSQPPAVGDTVSSNERRAARIADYHREAVARNDSLAACVGVANADLFELDGRLHEVLQRALGAGVNSLAEIKQLDPAIKRRLETLKQVERLTQLDIRLSQSKKRTQNE